MFASEIYKVFNNRYSGEYLRTTPSGKNLMVTSISDIRGNIAFCIITLHNKLLRGRASIINF